MAVYLESDANEIDMVAYKCFGNGCGWMRNYTPKTSWLEKVIDHPLYGEISNRNAVYNDVNAHRCIHHKRAVARLREDVS